MSLTGPKSTHCPNRTSWNAIYASLYFIAVYIPALSRRFSHFAGGIFHLLATTNGQLVPLTEGNHTATCGIGDPTLTNSVIAETEDTVAYGIAETEPSGAATTTGVKRIGEVTGAGHGPLQVASGATINRL